jgi:PAS domain S-box-containing protein
MLPKEFIESDPSACLRILIVEDTPADADLLVMHLSREGYKFSWLRVESEAEFLSALKTPYDLILSDWILPQFSGMRAFQLLVESGLEIPFIIVSGGIGEETAVSVMRQGASDYLLKDRLDRLGQAVRNALEQKNMRIERRRSEELLNLQASALNAAANAIVITDIAGTIEWANAAFSKLSGYSSAETLGLNLHELVKSDKHDPIFIQSMWDTILSGNVWQGVMINSRKDSTLYTEEMTITPIKTSSGKIQRFIAIKQDISERILAEEAVQKSARELMLAYDSTLQGWSTALEMREHETAGHSQRVVHTTLRLAHIMGVKEGELVHIQRGALLHDIGKMGIPDTILLKPGPLNSEEWEIMRHHPEYACRLLSMIPYLKPALDIPYCHHEKWDGTGYPQGLKGEEIPLAARIFALVDVLDALSNDRPYRKAWTQDTIYQYIRDQMGKHFDPRVVDAYYSNL